MEEALLTHSDFDGMELRSFNANELDLLMAICNELRDRESDEAVLSFPYIRGLADYKPKDDRQLANDLRRTNKKMLQLNTMLRDTDRNGTTVQFVLFNHFITSEESKTLTVKVNEPFKWVLSELDNNYSREELQQFVKLKSTYAKECYRQLKRHSDTGIWETSLEDFRKLLVVPKSYKISNIDQRILKPIREELSPLFDNLTIDKMYDYTGKGRPSVSGIFFSFVPEPRFKDVGKAAEKLCSDATMELHLPSEATEQAVTSRLYQRSNYICPQCKELLYSTYEDGRQCWCHEGYYEKPVKCQALYLDPEELQTQASCEEKTTEPASKPKRGLLKYLADLFSRI